MPVTQPATAMIGSALINGFTSFHANSAYNGGAFAVLAPRAPPAPPARLSVFGIARAHGYKATSRFWHDELKALVNTLMAYDQAKGACPQKVEPSVPEQPAS